MSGPAVVPLTLTDDEREILRCWRSMSLRAQLENMAKLQRDAERTARIKHFYEPPAPKFQLRLVASGKERTATKVAVSQGPEIQK